MVRDAAARRGAVVAAGAAFVATCVLLAVSSPARAEEGEPPPPPPTVTVVPTPPPPLPPPDPAPAAAPRPAPKRAAPAPAPSPRPTQPSPPAAEPVATVAGGPARASSAGPTSARPEQARKQRAVLQPRAAAPAARRARPDRDPFATLPFRVGGGAAPVAGGAVRLVGADSTVVAGEQDRAASAYLWIITGLVLASLLVGAVAVRDLAPVARRRAGRAHEWSVSTQYRALPLGHEVAIWTAASVATVVLALIITIAM